MVCRLVANFNLEPLRIVGKKKDFNFEMEWMAYNAEEEIEKILYFDSIEDSLSDIEFSFGTGMIQGKNRGEFIELNSVPERLNQTLKNFAFIFGRENTGMTNQAVDKCNFMIDFKLNSTQPSMNLSNSVSYVLGYYFNQNKSEVSSAETQMLNPKLYILISDLLDKLNLNQFHSRENLASKRMKKILEEGIKSEDDNNFLFRIFRTLSFETENQHAEK